MGDDTANSVYAFTRHDPEGEHPPVLVVLNATPIPRGNYRIGVPVEGPWREILNTDAREYGGSGRVHKDPVETVPLAAHGSWQSLVLELPPLGVTVLAPGVG